MAPEPSVTMTTLGPPGHGQGCVYVCLRAYVFGSVRVNECARVCELCACMCGG